MDMQLELLTNIALSIKLIPFGIKRQVCEIKSTQQYILYFIF